MQRHFTEDETLLKDRGVFLIGNSGCFQPAACCPSGKERDPDTSSKKWYSYIPWTDTCQVTQSDLFYPLVEGHQQPLKGSCELTIPKMSPAELPGVQMLTSMYSHCEQFCFGSGVVDHFLYQKDFGFWTSGLFQVYPGSQIGGPHMTQWSWTEKTIKDHYLMTKGILCMCTSPGSLKTIKSEWLFMAFHCLIQIQYVHIFHKLIPGYLGFTVGLTYGV